MNIRIPVTALALALGFSGFAMQEAAAKPKAKQIVKKINKSNERYRKDVRRSFNRTHNHYYKPYRYERPDYDHESFNIYATPGGGIGFHYTESNGSYPYYYGY